MLLAGSPRRACGPAHRAGHSLLTAHISARTWPWPSRSSRSGPSRGSRPGRTAGPGWCSHRCRRGRC